MGFFSLDVAKCNDLGKEARGFSVKNGLGAALDKFDIEL